MQNDPEFILKVLDDCGRQFTFPALDNGFWYPAATRLSIHYSPEDWGLVIETFGYNPRFGLPDLSVQTFASRLHNRRPPDTYTAEQRTNYLTNNPYNEFASFFPIARGTWMSAEEPETVLRTGFVELRGKPVPLPSLDGYAKEDIHLEGDRPAIYELCRYLAAQHRESVLATPTERRVNLPPELAELAVLDEWRHPDLIAGELPSQTTAFRDLAQVLSTGDASLYRPREAPNTDWRFWPEGGSL